VLGLALAVVLGVGTSAAQQSGTCRTGTLVGFDTRTQTIGGLNNGHYEEKVKKNGKKSIDGNNYTVEQTQEFYVLTVQVGEMLYTAENAKNMIFGYNPTDMVVNDPIEACVEKNKLVLTRPDGKKYKTRLVRQERVRSSGRAAADGMSSK
jgi:hypothetical protein